MTRRNDKKSWLISSAERLFHQQGISSTTLANIAELAKVPLGNVYYYFKSKDSIVLAVAEYHIENLRSIFDLLALEKDPKQRLMGLLQKLFEQEDIICGYGDPVVALCIELSRQNAALQAAASNLLDTLLHWITNQFTQITTGDADIVARKFLAETHGLAIQVAAYKNKQIIQKGIKSIASSFNLH